MRSIALKTLFLIVAFFVAGWCALAALYAPILPIEMKEASASLCAVLGALFMLRPRKYLVHSAILFGTIFLLWARLKPSNDRDWPVEISKLPWAEIRGDEVTIHNVRDFDYRTAADFDPRWTTKTVRLSDLSSVDMYASYWGSPKIAHIFLTFGFGEKEFISISVETRRSKDQTVQSIESLFRNYEIIYVVAEERDLVAVRTNYRDPTEDVYLFRLAFFKPKAIELFKNYLRSMNELVERPKFYNMLMTNCTTQVFANTESAGRSRFKYNWRILFSGYTPDYAYLMGNLDTSHSIEELRRLGYVNPRAAGPIGEPLEFSEKIRVGVPKPQLFAADPDSAPVK